MPATTPNRWLAIQHMVEPLAAVEYICIATDLLHQVFLLFQSLAVNNSEFARALSIFGTDVPPRLADLRRTNDQLKCGDTLSPAGLLNRRATGLISSLSQTIDKIAWYASCDDYPIDKISRTERGP